MLAQAPSRVSPGDPIRAADWNVLAEGVRASAPMPHVGGTLETTLSGTASRIRADQFPAPRRDAPPPSYPWGSQWMWGFEWAMVDGAAAFRLHSTHVLMGRKMFRSILRDQFEGVGSSYATILAPATVPEEEQGEDYDPDDPIEWGIAIDVEWTSFAQYDPATTNLVDAQAAIVWDEALMSTPAEAGTTETAPGRIPVAWFTGLVIQRDYVHGLVLPQLWV